MNFIFVALGGGVGAALRYAISLIPVRTDFPVLTLITNIIGALVIGFIVGVFDKRENISPNALLFWKTGVCGGFTTFSTFSLEAFSLFNKKMNFFGFIYIVLSVLFCLFGVFCGKKTAHFLL